jgi:hypothetical protein
VFSDRRDDGSDVSEDLRALEGAESSRDFHAQLHHAQVPFGLIVGEGNCQVRKEPQDVIAAVSKRSPRPIDVFSLGRLTLFGVVRLRARQGGPGELISEGVATA